LEKNSWKNDKDLAHQVNLLNPKIKSIEDIDLKNKNMKTQVTHLHKKIKNVENLKKENVKNKKNKRIMMRLKKQEFKKEEHKKWWKFLEVKLLIIKTLLSLLMKSQSKKF